VDSFSNKLEKKNDNGISKFLEGKLGGGGGAVLEKRGRRRGILQRPARGGAQPATQSRKRRYDVPRGAGRGEGRSILLSLGRKGGGLS